ncbi:MAG: serpin family protein [Acidimicrobiales bacterium]
MRRALIPLAAAVLLGATAVGCGDEPSYFEPSHVEGKASGKRATPEEVAVGADAVRTVGADVYGKVRAGDGNLAFSPLSIATTLGMLRAGANGTSATQLDDLFAAPDGTDLHRALGGVGSDIGTAAGPVQLANGDMGEVELSDASSTWGQSGVEWEQAYLDQLAEGYGASMWMADYASDPEQARKDINAWVGEHTGGHIEDLLPQGSVHDATRLVLANALYLKAPWPEALDVIDGQPFHPLAGDDVQVTMLGTDGELPYATGDGWQAVTVPLAGNHLALTLLVPDEGRFREVEAALDPELLAAATSGTATGVDLRFPKFDLDQRTAVGKALKALGVTAPFTTTSDFEPMTTDAKAQPLQLEDVLHQATITVDEGGIEASAATGATMQQTSAALGNQEVTVDRPFLFVVHDTTNATPIFLGRVLDPTAS